METWCECFQMVGVQLGGEDGVQHSSFCIQINDISSSGKSGPLAALLASPMSSMQICPQRMGKGAAQVCSALLVQLLCCHRRVSCCHQQLGSFAGCWCKQPSPTSIISNSISSQGLRNKLPKLTNSYFFPLQGGSLQQGQPDSGVPISQLA